MTSEAFANAAIDCLDEVASAMERKWGVGRLPKLADAQLAVRFGAQAGKLNEAIGSKRADAIVAHAAAMERAWKALEAAAVSARAGAHGADDLAGGYPVNRRSDRHRAHCR